MKVISKPTLNFVKKKSYTIFRTHCSTKPSNLCRQKKSQESLHNSKDSASGVQEGVVEQVIV